MDPEVSPEIRQALRALQVRARRCRGTMPLDAPERKASEALSELLAKLHASGLSWSALDRAMGVVIGTSSSRVARHGHRPAAPSHKPYRGVRWTVPPMPGRKGPRKDLTGQKFDRLTAIEPTGEVTRGGVLWRWRCECGGERVALGPQVKAGKVRSCGTCSPPPRVAEPDAVRLS